MWKRADWVADFLSGVDLNKVTFNQDDVFKAIDKLNCNKGAGSDDYLQLSLHKFYSTSPLI